MDAVRGVRLLICALILTFLTLPIYQVAVPVDGDYSDTEPVSYLRVVDVTVETPSDNRWPSLHKFLTPVLEHYVMPDDPAVRQVADALDAHAQKWGYSERRTAELVHSWVASNIRYESDEDAHGRADYWQTPYETLRRGTGDCEDFAVLFCSICEALGLETVIVSEPGHVSAAVLVDVEVADTTVSYSGRTYVAVETTSNVALGGATLDSYIVYPTHIGLAVALIVLVDLVVIGLTVYIMRSMIW